MFLLEIDDDAFRVVNPSGEFDEPRPFMDVSTIDYQGKVYGAFLQGKEEELTTGKVYDLSKWPVLVEVPCRIDPTEFAYDDDEPDGEVIDVEPVVGKLGPVE
jgi:hypothetical protein